MNTVIIKILSNFNECEGLVYTSISSIANLTYFYSSDLNEIYWLINTVICKIDIIF